jgi:hypothetical protein
MTRRHLAGSRMKAHPIETVLEEVCPLLTRIHINFRAL